MGSRSGGAGRAGRTAAQPAWMTDDMRADYFGIASLREATNVRLMDTYLNSTILAGDNQGLLNVTLGVEGMEDELLKRATNREGLRDVRRMRGQYTQTARGLTESTVPNRRERISTTREYYRNQALRAMGIEGRGGR